MIEDHQLRHLIDPYPHCPDCGLPIDCNAIAYENKYICDECIYFSEETCPVSPLYSPDTYRRYLEENATKSNFQEACSCSYWQKLKAFEVQYHEDVGALIEQVNELQNRCEYLVKEWDKARGKAEYYHKANLILVENYSDSFVSKVIDDEK